MRVVSPAATLLWRNTEGTVIKRTGESEVQVAMKLAASIKQSFHLGDLYFLTSKEVVPMAEAALDLRRLTNQAKATTLQSAGNQVRYVQLRECLEHPEMAAWFWQLWYRAEQSGDKLYNGELTYLCPTVSEVAVKMQMEGTSSPAEIEKELTHWRELLKPVMASQGRAMVVSPVYNGGHWVLLTWTKQRGEKLGARYFDSLRPYSVNCLTKARAIHQIVIGILGDAVEPDFPELVETPFSQTDAWSCGFHAANRVEEVFRSWRGEGIRRLYRTPEEVRQELNKWLDTLIKFKAAEDVRMAAGKPTIPAVAKPPPPLPPPSEPIEVGEEEEGVLTMPLAISCRKSQVSLSSLA